MEKNDFKEIMDTLREISVEQAALKERVEAHLKVTEKNAEKIEDHAKSIAKHDTFMRASLWVYGFIISGLGIKFFNSN